VGGEGVGDGGTKKKKSGGSKRRCVLFQRGVAAGREEPVVERWGKPVGGVDVDNTAGNGWEKQFQKRSTLHLQKIQQTGVSKVRTQVAGKEKKKSQFKKKKNEKDEQKKVPHRTCFIGGGRKGKVSRKKNGLPTIGKRPRRERTKVGGKPD